MRNAWLCAVALFAALGVSGAASADTVKVGVIEPASGPFARWATQFEAGIRIYQKQHGDAVDGHKIEIVYRDVGGPDPARAKQLAQELILRDKVNFLGGFVFTPNAMAVADLVTQAKMPTIIFNAGASVIVRKSPYFVRDSQTMPQIAFPMGIWAAKHGIKKVVTLVSDYAPGYDAEEYFIKTFTAGGGQILEKIHIPLRTSDFSPFFERALQEKPDAVFTFGPGGPFTVNLVNTWATRLKPAGVTLLCTSETQQIDLPKIGKAALGVISSFHYTESIDNPLNNKLWADMQAMYGKDAVPDLATVAAYDAMHMIYAAVAKFGSGVTGDQALSLWKGMKFDSPRGPIEIDPDTRDIVENIYYRKVEERDGKLVNVNFGVLPMVKDPWKADHPK
jgi:branched-chain amino acid transport system substrate-binding protein